MSSNENADPAEIGMRIRGANGQTANLFVVEVYGGTDKFVIDSDGDVTITGALTLTGTMAFTGTTEYTGEMAIAGDTAATITLKVTAATSQSADIFVVENKAGTDLFKVDASGNATLVGNLTQTGNTSITGTLGVTGAATLPAITGPTTLTGNLDITGEFFAKGAMPPADYVVMLDGATYKAFSCRTGDLLTSSATYMTVWEAAEAALTNGTGAILDMTGMMGVPAIAANPVYALSAPQLVEYASGVPHDRRFEVRDPLSTRPRTCVTCFDEGIGASDWVVTAGTVTSTTESSEIKRGSASIKATGVTDVLTATDFELTLRDYAGSVRSVDLSRCNFAIRLKGDLTKLAGVCVWFGSDDSGWTNYYGHTAGNFSRNSAEGGDWHTLGAWRLNQTATGSPNWSTVKRIRVRLQCTAGETADYVMDELSAFSETSLQRNVIIFSFDDGECGAVDASATLSSAVKPVFDRHGYRAVCCQQVQQYETHSTTEAAMIAGLKLLKEAGWDIACHSFAHEYWDTLTEKEIALRIIKWYRWLEQSGLGGQQYDVFAWPYGAYDYESWEVVKRYFHMGRSTASNIFTTWPSPVAHVFPATIMDSQSVANAKSAIDTISASVSRYVTVWYFHGIGGPYNVWSTAELDEVLDYCHAKNIDVWTFSDLMTNTRHRIAARPLEYHTSATVTAGTSYATVYHGLAITPGIGDIQVVPQASMLGRNWWVSDITATTFRINMSAIDTINHVFTWSVVM